MPLILTSIKADLAREAAGDWVEYPDWPGVAFNVSSLYAPAYATARDLMVQRLTAKYLRQPIPPGELAVETGALYCEHILHDWRGLDVEYTAEVALKTLSDPAYRKVVAAVEWCAAKLSETEVAFTDNAEKN